MTHEPVVYAIRNSINGKRYVGSTSNLINRKKKHLADLRRGRHHSAILQRAYTKYGESVFVFEVVEAVANVAILLNREQFYLDLWKPEYNVSTIANEKTRLGMKSTAEHCEHMSASLKGRKSPNEGQHLSEGHRRKISIANTGKTYPSHTVSDESKKRMSLAAKKRDLSYLRVKEYQAKGAAALKKWRLSLTDEQRAEASRRSSERQRTPDRHAVCAICEQGFTYRPNGKKVPRTCGVVCRSEIRRRLLADRRLADPLMDRRAILARWGKKEDES